MIFVRINPYAGRGAYCTVAVDDAAGYVSDDEAFNKAKQSCAKDVESSYLLNCLELGNFRIERRTA